MKFRNLKNHRYLLAVAVAAFILYALFFHNRLYGEINGSFISYGLVMKEAYSNGEMPHWTPLLSGGYPLLSNPEIPIFGILNLVIFLLPGVVLAFGIAILLHIAIAGVGAALLCFEFTQSRHAAVVSGVVFIISGAFAFALFSGTMPFLYPLAFLPWILLFSYRALKKPAANIVLAALFLALQLLSGGTIYFFWTLLGMGLLLATYAFFSLLKGKIDAAVKPGIILFLIAVFSLGFAAVKLVPGIAFIELTSRASGVDYQSFIWPFTQIQLAQLPSALLFKSSFVKVGIVAFSLALIGFAASFRKKFGVAFLAISLIAILIEVDTFVTRIFFSLPGFGQTRQIYNVFALLSLSIAVMAGVGWAKIMQLKAFGRLRRFSVWATALIILLVAAEL